MSQWLLRLVRAFICLPRLSKARSAGEPHGTVLTSNGLSGPDDRVVSQFEIGRVARQLAANVPCPSMTRPSLKVRTSARSIPF